MKFTEDQEARRVRHIARLQEQIDILCGANGTNKERENAIIKANLAEIELEADKLRRSLDESSCANFKQVRESLSKLMMEEAGLRIELNRLKGETSP
mgnify:CR=1 FL=1